MTSSFTWLDYSERERRKMLEVIKQFDDRDTRDEIGIGSIRDAFADLFFPGTSTIQTRARYFFFVPWIYLALENKNGVVENIAKRARQTEADLIGALREAGETDGLIGKQAGEALQRMPSNIYWQGLGALGIRKFPGSQEQYHHWFKRYGDKRDRVNQERSDARAQKDDLDTFHPRENWHSSLPPAPENFPQRASLNLTQTEAEYLQERIVASAPKSLFAYSVTKSRHNENTPFPWSNEVDSLPSSPSPLREQVEHAQNFSEVILGAALLYNLMLAEKREPKGDLVDQYQDSLKQWYEKLKARSDALTVWNRPRFWQIVTEGNPRVPAPTHHFVEDWLNIALDLKRSKKITDNNDARQLIEQRERFLKRGLARLDNPRALELWSGAAGTAQINYRWSVAQRMLSDIYQGLNRKGKNHA